MTQHATQAEKVAQLQAALQEYQEQGSDLFAQPDSEIEQAFGRAIRLLQQRGRSEFEIRQRLRALDYDAATVDAVVQRLERDRYLDDADFAAEWVRQRHEMRGKSRMMLDRELREKGIAEPLRRAALAQIDESDEADTALYHARKRAARIKQVPADRAEYHKELRKVLGVVARRGFPQSLAMQVAQQALEEQFAVLQEQ